MSKIKGRLITSGILVMLYAAFRVLYAPFENLVRASAGDRSWHFSGIQPVQCTRSDRKRRPRVLARGHLASSGMEAWHWSSACNIVGTSATRSAHGCVRTVQRNDGRRDRAQYDRLLVARARRYH